MHVSTQDNYNTSYHSSLNQISTCVMAVVLNYNINTWDIFLTDLILTDVHVSQRLVKLQTSLNRYSKFSLYETIPMCLNLRQDVAKWRLWLVRSPVASRCTFYSASSCCCFARMQARTSGRSRASGPCGSSCASSGGASWWSSSGTCCMRRASRLQQIWLEFN